MGMLQVPVHPGKILKLEFLAPMGMSSGKFAKHIHVPRTRIERLCAERTSLTVDTAKRLARALNTTPQFWMNLQAHYDLLSSEAEDIKEIGPLIAACE